MQNSTRKITSLAMISAVAYVVMAVGRIPIVAFLKYDPKDVVITIGGFIFGPLASFIVSLLVSFVEMLTVSGTGPIGLVMNVLSTVAFACPAAYIYKKKHTLSGAVIGLIIGTILMTAVMLLWNYLITPLYMTVPREKVVAMLLPTFLPFNLFKGGLNAALTMLLYKPIVKGLRKANLVPAPGESGGSGNISAGVTIVSGIVLLTFILMGLVLKGII